MDHVQEPSLLDRVTKDAGVRLSSVSKWDESARPTGPVRSSGPEYSETGRAVGLHLVEVHDHLRGELSTVRDIARQVIDGLLAVGDARSAINVMTMRQNDWTLGAYCASYCRIVTQHHSLEDAQVFPHLRRSDEGLAAVIDRLEAEHLVIHEVLEELDAALVRFIRDSSDSAQLREAVDVLTDTLLSHLAYEEQQLVEPLARYGFFPGQV
jgi:hypothetical protein